MKSFEHIWFPPDSQINNGKMWSAFSDSFSVSDANKIASNLNFLYDSLGEKTLSLSNGQNLLINGEFKVNQRRLTTYSMSDKPTNIPSYTVDRFYLKPQVLNSQSSVGVSSNYITVNLVEQFSSFGQIIENSSVLSGSTVTLSVKGRNTGSANLVLRIMDGTSELAYSIINSGATGIFSTTVKLEQVSNISAQIINTTTNSGQILLEYMKLEVGSVPTANSPRHYGGELALCQRYYCRLNPNSILYGYSWANNTARISLKTPVPMRSIPKSIESLSTENSMAYTTLGQIAPVPSSALSYFYDRDGNELCFTVTLNAQIGANFPLVYRVNSQIELDSEIYQ